MSQNKAKQPILEARKNRSNQKQKKTEKKATGAKDKWVKPIIYKADVFLYCMKEG